jgi:hypothetical protein
VTYGKTEDQAIAMKHEAIELYIESSQVHGEAIPPAEKSTESEHDEGWRRWRGELTGTDALTEHLTGHADEMGQDIESQVTAPDALADEREFWYRLAAQGLALAYGDDEPDYSLAMIKEPNPEYKLQ